MNDRRILSHFKLFVCVCMCVCVCDAVCVVDVRVCGVCVRVCCDIGLHVAVSH